MSHMSTGSLEFTEQVFNTGGGACSHADAAESVYGAGGGGVRRREGRGFLSQLASNVKGGGGDCSDLSYRWVEGAGPLESLSQVPLWLLRDVKAGISGSNTDEPLGWRRGRGGVGG